MPHRAKFLIRFLYQMIPLPRHGHPSNGRAHFRHHFKLHVCTFLLAGLTWVGMVAVVLASTGVKGWELFAYSIDGGKVTYVGVRGVGDGSGLALDTKSISQNTVPWSTPRSTTSLFPWSVWFMYWFPIYNLLAFLISGPVCWSLDYGMHAHQHHGPDQDVRKSASFFACSMGVFVFGAEVGIMFVACRLQLLEDAVVVDFVPGLIFWLQGIWVTASAAWVIAMHCRIRREAKLAGLDVSGDGAVHPGQKDSST